MPSNGNELCFKSSFVLLAKRKGRIAQSVELDVGLCVCFKVDVVHQTLTLRRTKIQSLRRSPYFTSHTARARV